MNESCTAHILLHNSICVWNTPGPCDRLNEVVLVHVAAQQLPMLLICTKSHSDTYKVQMDHNSGLLVNGEDLDNVKRLYWTSPKMKCSNEQKTSKFLSDRLCHISINIFNHHSRWRQREFHRIPSLHYARLNSFTLSFFLPIRRLCLNEAMHIIQRSPMHTFKRSCSYGKEVARTLNFVVPFYSWRRLCRRFFLPFMPVVVVGVGFFLASHICASVHTYCSERLWEWVERSPHT